MADWRSPVAVSNSPWTQPPHHYQSMDSADGLDEEKQQHGAGTTPRGQVYNPFQLQPQPQSHPRPQRLHIDDLRESPMRHDLISLESNPRAPIVYEDPQPQTQGRPHPPQSVSSTEASSGSFLNQLVTGLWQPRRQAVPAAPAQELPAHYVQQQTPQQQRLSATRTFEDMLPRRSLLVPSPTEFDIGRHTLDPEELLSQPQRTTSPSMRNLHQFRPVAAPPGAPSSSTTGGSAPPRSTRVEAGRSLRPTPPQTEDEQSRDASTTTSSSREQQRNDPDNSAASRATSVERARQIFASKQVRLENSWYNDMWIYMKNAHPFIGICGAHRWHPYKRRDRIVVLLVALLVTFLCCGVFATQKCCDSVLEVPIAVVARRLTSSSNSISNDLTSRSSPSSIAQQCAPFYGECGSSSDGSVSLCTQGSSCITVPGRSDKQCLPVVTTAASLMCGAGDHLLTCPTGWSCNGSTHKCTPSSSLVCYLPRTSTPPTALSFVADSGTDGGSGITAIEAIFSILIIANNASTSNSNSTSSSTSGSGSQVDSSADGGAIGSSSSGSTSSVVDSRNDQTAQSISVALTKPSDGGVYSVASSIPVEWEVSSLSGNSDGDDQPLKSFSVEFSADGKTFTQIASDVTSSSEKKSSTADRKSAVFHYDWQLNNNTSLLCTNCVLRVCAAVGDGTSDANAKNSVCIRSDGGGGDITDTNTSSLVVTRSASAASRKGITFRIVREIVQCSCGLAHASFVQFSYLIALVLPLTVLILQQLVTFYQDSKLWGLFSRRGGPEIPKLCFYGRAATRVGRVVIVVVLAAACLGSGFQAAQVSDANFYNQKGEIVLLWLGMYALCVLIGFVYCSAACLAIFSLRWKLELTHKSRVGHPPSDFDVSLHVASLEEEGRDGNRTPVLQA